MTDPIDSLSRGFRQKFLTYQELTEQVHAWRDAFPQLVRVRSIGTSLEGRELWLLELGPEPDRDRPTAWVDGNMHATELSGSSVALGIAEDFLRLHLDPTFDAYGLSATVRESLKQVRVFVLPRMCPDGAEAVITTGQYVRSNPRDRRVGYLRPRWLAKDINNDGQAFLMRREDPTGEFVESSVVKGLMVQRDLNDSGPFYKVYPEGVIEDWDGKTIPDPYFLGDNDTDLNRNFPWHWAPEPEQEGAGMYATSEPEARAVVEFVTKHPTIFAWLNLHTFGGVYIRPLGTAADNKMNPSDLAVFRQVAQWGQQYGGYPTVSGFEEFTYEPDKPLHGSLADYAYHQRGAIALVCELWDLFAQLGFEKPKRFVDNYTHLTRAQTEAFGVWDAAHNKGRIVRPWVEFNHPQLGAVDVGGVDSRVGMSNPPLEMVADVCSKQAAFYLRLAALAPAVRVGTPMVESLGAELYKVTCVVENLGYLPTHVLDSAENLAFNEPLGAHVHLEGELRLMDGQTPQVLGHLDGWGRGLFSGAFALFFQRSKGSVSRKELSWVIRGKGTFVIHVESCRVGSYEQRVVIG